MHMTYGGHHTYIHEASHTCSSKVPYIHVHVFIYLFILLDVHDMLLYIYFEEEKIIKSKFFDLFTIHTKSFTLSVKRN